MVNPGKAKGHNSEYRIWRDLLPHAQAGTGMIMRDDALYHMLFWLYKKTLRLLFYEVLEFIFYSSSNWAFEAKKLVSQSHGYDYRKTMLVFGSFNSIAKTAL